MIKLSFILSCKNESYGKALPDQKRASEEAEEGEDKPNKQEEKLEMPWSV